MQNVISADQVVKTFGRVRALDGLEMQVDAGQVHGFLGPNGAGKTTTLRIILGLTRATSGTLSVFGADPWAEAVALHRRMAYVPGDVSLWPNLTGGESIDLLARLRGAGRDEQRYQAEKKRLMDAFQFDPRLRGRTYSKGNRQKVALIAALAVPAELYVLDEPTSGLDPLMEVVFRTEMSRVKDEGATVLLSSHILSEVEVLCDHVSLIRAGRIVESGSLVELRHLSRDRVSFLADSADAAAELPGAHDVEYSQGRVSFTIEESGVPELVTRLGTGGVRGLRIAPLSLEELFLRLYGDRPRRAADAGDPE